MKSKYQNKKNNKPEQNPEFIAQQLRKPSGDFAGKISKTMDMVNRPLYDLVLETMDVTDHNTILEIGFGSGKYFGKLLSKASQLRISAIDYSKEMVDEARGQNAAPIASGKLRLYLGSSDNLPFDDNSFDIVFCNMVVYFWDNPEAHLKEVHRVLKPGRKFYTGLRTRKSMLQFPFTKYGFNLYEESEWKSILGKNGFVVTGAPHKTEPKIEDDEQSIQLESVCVIAEKMSNHKTPE